MITLLRKLYQLYVRTFVNDVTYIKRKFKKKMGYRLDLENPQTLNEKINWLKINDRTPLHTICSDKFAVREYVADKIGAIYLVPLYFHTDNILAINDQNITTFPCIIKTNHDSSGGIFLRANEDVNWKQIQSSLLNRMKSNYYHKTREWQYKNIHPRVIVEQLLLTEEDQIPADIKVHVINNEPELIQMDVGRGTKDHFRNWYSPSWDLLPMRWNSILKDGKETDPKDVPVKEPRYLQKILELSKILAKPFLYARIDWYEVGDRIYFGEITFHHDGGNRPILPREWDLKLGQKLDLKLLTE